MYPLLQSSFRNTGEIKALAGVDYLTIAPALLEELKNSTEQVPKKLASETAKKDGPSLSLPMHRAVLDAVIAHNPARAERAILKLIDGAREDIEEVLSQRRRPPRNGRAPPRVKATA